MSASNSQAIKAFVKRRKESPHGAGHYHITDLYPRRVRVSIAGIEVASSNRVEILKEVGTSVYNPVFYFPKNDVNLGLFEEVKDYSTFCPIKGDATYWNFNNREEQIEKAAWSYESPLEYSEAISGYLGFDQRFATITIDPSS